MRNNFTYLICFIFATCLLSSCGTEYETSSITGWDYNNPKNGGFQKVPYSEQETGPGLILIEGGKHKHFNHIISLNLLQNIYIYLFEIFSVYFLKL